MHNQWQLGKMDVHMRVGCCSAQCCLRMLMLFVEAGGVSW